MSQELAQDEEDAEDYDLESFEYRGDTRVMDDDDDDDTLIGSRRGGPASIAEDSVVFEIGDEDDHGSDDEDRPKRKHNRQPSGDGSRREQEGLMERSRDDEE